MSKNRRNQLPGKHFRAQLPSASDDRSKKRRPKLLRFFRVFGKGVIARFLAVAFFFGLVLLAICLLVSVAALPKAVILPSFLALLIFGLGYVALGARHPNLVEIGVSPTKLTLKVQNLGREREVPTMKEDNI